MKKKFILLLILLVLDVGAQTSNSDVAVSLLEKQYRHIKESGNPDAIADAASQAGEAHLQTKNYKRSIDFLLVAKDIYKKQDDSKNLAKISCRLAENYFRSGNVKRYRDYIDLAEKLIANDTLSNEYALLLDTQIGYFKATKKFNQAQYLIDRKAQLQKPAPQKAAQSNVPKAIAVLTQAKARPSTAKPVEKKETDLVSPLTHQKKQELILAFCVALAMLSSLGLIYYFYKDHRRKIRQRMQFNAMQSQLLENISVALQKAPPQQMSSIAQNLSLLAAITAEKKIPDFRPQPIGPLLQSLASPFLVQAALNKITVVSNIDETEAQKPVDAETLKTIVALMWNEALSRTDSQNPLYFSATVDKQLELRISYPAGLLENAQVMYLFDSFYRDDVQDYPNPVGFALLKALVKWYDGKIDAALDGNLLRIEIRLPLSVAPKPPKMKPGLVL